MLAQPPSVRRFDTGAPLATVRTKLLDPDRIELSRAPRDDLLVREIEVSPGHFTAVEGPFARWERVVTEQDAVWTQTVSYRLAAPHWGHLVDILLRRGVRSGVDGTRGTIWLASDRLSRHEVTVLSLCATLSLIAGFLGGIVGQTLTFISKDLGGSTSAQATILTIIRLGAVITMLATALADKRGRRPVLHASLVGAALASLVTAVAPNLTVVTVSQLIARSLVATAAFLITIVLVEELSPGSRAYAVGLMALPGALGVGMVLWILPIVDARPSAWRIIFAFALPALILTVRTMRRFPETARFEHDTTEPKHRLRQHMRPARFAVLATTVYLINVFAAPTQQLQNDYLRTARGFDGSRIAAFALLTNTWGFIGIAFGARLSDRRSRRLALGIGVVGFAIGNGLMFQVAGWPMWIASMLGSIVGAAIVPSLGALLPELFPTLRRGSANGAMNAAAVLGSITGLQVAGHTIENGNYGPTMAVLAVAPLLVLVLLRWIPETSGVSLETLNPEDPTP